MSVSYHNHTHWSDGTGVVADYVAAARQAGLTEVGISDHLTLAPGGRRVEWSMALADMPGYVAELQKAAKATRDVTVRQGIEADFFPETVGALRTLLAQQTLDYVIGSVHFVDAFPIDEDAAHWDALSPDERNDMWRRYWQRIEELAQSGVFDIVAHLDLPKKFGHRPTADLHVEEGRALDAIADAALAIEINTNGWNKPAREAYPALHLLIAAHERDIPLIISADAHRPEGVTQHFADAVALARRAGYAACLRFDHREHGPVPFP